MINKAFYTIIAFILLNTVSFTQKQIPPVGGEPKDFKLPKKTVFQLDNGLAVTMVQFGKVPKVTVSIVVRVGSINEKQDKIWISSMVGAMMKEGTHKRNAEKIRESIALMGGSLDVNVSDEKTVLSCDVLGEKGPDCIELLADVLQNPKFPESELQRLKNDKLRELSLAKADPHSMTKEKFMQVLYKDHPFGLGLPTEEIINGFSIGDIIDFYKNNFGAKRSHIYVVGKFDEKDIEDAVRDAFNDWKSGPEVETDIPQAVSKREIYINDRPGAAQSTIMMGLPVIDPTDEDFIPLEVTNSILGGSFTSRITSNIREQKGYSYSPHSVVGTFYRTAYWAEIASVGTEVTGAALKEIFYEIGRLRSEPPSADELKGIANYIAGTFVLLNSIRGGIIDQLVFLDLHGLEDTYLTNYVKNVHSVTPDKIKKVMIEYFKPDGMTIVITGDRKVIDSQLKGFGTIRK